MPRTARKESSTGFYHVITRGVNRRPTFEDDRDRSRFMAILQDALERAGGTLHAWCLMSNHVHLLLEMELESLSLCMKILNQNYASYFNAKYGRTGHLYQQRYRSEPVETVAYLLTVTRYIHQNPVKAFMTPDCRCRWSSYGQYLGEQGPVRCETGTVLGEFGGLPEFLQFHSILAFEDRCLEIRQRMADEEARVYAERIIGEGVLDDIAVMRVEDRDRLLRMLKGCMLPMTQIARIAQVSPMTVSRA